MSKPDMVLWWVRWDKAGNVIERRYRPFNPADAASPDDPEAPIRKRGFAGREAQLGLFGQPN